MKIIGKYMTLWQPVLQNEPGSQCVPFHSRILHIKLWTVQAGPAMPDILKAEISYLEVPGRSQTIDVDMFLMYMTVIPQNFKFNF